MEENTGENDSVQKEEVNRLRVLRKQKKQKQREKFTKENKKKTGIRRQTKKKNQEKNHGSGFTNDTRKGGKRR